MRLIRLFALFLLLIVPTRHGFTCPSEEEGGGGDGLCVACKKMGETAGVKTYFGNDLCSIYADVRDAGEEYSVPERCELLFSRLYPTSCQQGIISNVDLLGYYIQYGIRSTDHSMLLSLKRDNCSSVWNWMSRLENTTTPAGTGVETEPCDVVQGAFVGFNQVRINPTNFTPTGVLCQCSEPVSFLPVVSNTDFKLEVFLLLTVALLIKIIM